ncbi:MAG TPA: hypothetical protein VF613_18740, partial [Longimicrobium sp.]
GIFRYGTRTYLHAGAGIVPGSVPENEFAETQHKLANAREALAWTVGSEQAGTAAREQTPVREMAAEMVLAVR